MTFSIMTFSTMTFSIMTFSNDIRQKTFSIMTFSSDIRQRAFIIMTFNIMPFRILPSSIITLDPVAECLHACHNKSILLNVIMPSVVMLTVVAPPQ